MIKGIIFDLDGTLLDTVVDLQTAVNLVMDEYNYPKQSYEQIKNKTGRGFRNLLKNSLPENSSDDLIDEATNKFKEYYKNCYLEKTDAYQGIKELINKLNNDGILLGVNSNKNTEYSENLIKQIFPHNKFVAIFGSRPNIPNKPDPTSALEIIKKMKLTTNEVIYVGDSEVDMQTANNAGLKVIACLWGFRDKETLEKCKIDYLVKTPEELYKIVKGEN